MPDGGFVTCFSDITRMRKTEQALKETNTYLEHRVSGTNGRTVDFERAAVSGEIEAEHANLGKTRFLASASQRSAATVERRTPVCLCTQSEPGSERRFIKRLYCFCTTSKAP